MAIAFVQLFHVFRTFENKAFKHTNYAFGGLDSDLW